MGLRGFVLGVLHTMLGNKFEGPCNGSEEI